jgi:formate hydrogenlyase transcriptional activator
MNGVGDQLLPGPGLVDSMLFGHERGAFTGALARTAGRFELADGGTLFLDEIGDMPVELQAKLLRVLQERRFERLGGTRSIPVNVRLIAATNSDLGAAVRDGRFREDLFFRINVFPIYIPPLRERNEDIPALVASWSAQGGVQRFVPPRVLAKLATHSWPGNVRELFAVLERAAILSSHELELGDWLPDGAVTALSSVAAGANERARVLEALARTGWRVSGERGAARLLGLKATTLEARMRRMGIVRPGQP